MLEKEFKSKVTSLIDSLKATSVQYGLGNDGNEFKIITQIFLYKFLNDKFIYESKKYNQKLAQAEDWFAAIEELSDDEFAMLNRRMGVNAKFKKSELLPAILKKINDPEIDQLLDDTLSAIAENNNDLFSISGEDGSKVILFERIISLYVQTKRPEFARAILSKIGEFSFEKIFNQKFDFYAHIFEHMIKDYNTNSGGKYAEYYTPHSVAKVIADILIPEELRQTDRMTNKKIYDPSAGTGTLLMNVAHAIGEERCSVFSQDISQKSASLLRLNLILNNLAESLPNIVQGNTILNPKHGDEKFFDYIVSNPPFKLDFSDWRDSITDTRKFFAGVPNIPKAKKDSMAIYQLFIQHILWCLKDTGKAAIVLPTGFITAQSGIDRRIREYLIDNQMLAGVVSMPSNIFATTGTNVSILFIDKENKGQISLIDASNLGTKEKQDGQQITKLSPEEEAQIVKAFLDREEISDFSVAVSYEQIKEKNYSFSAGQYFEIKIQHEEMTPAEFDARITKHTAELTKLFAESRQLEAQIEENLGKIEK